MLRLELDLILKIKTEDMQKTIVASRILYLMGLLISLLVLITSLFFFYVAFYSNSYEAVIALGFLNSILTLYIFNIFKKSVWIEIQDDHVVLQNIFIKEKYDLNDVIYIKSYLLSPNSYSIKVGRREHIFISIYDKKELKRMFRLNSNEI